MAVIIVPVVVSVFGVADQTLCCVEDCQVVSWCLTANAFNVCSEKRASVSTRQRRSYTTEPNEAKKTDT